MNINKWKSTVIQNTTKNVINPHTNLQRAYIMPFHEWRVQTFPYLYRPHPDLQFDLEVTTHFHQHCVNISFLIQQNTLSWVEQTGYGFQWLSQKERCGVRNKEEEEE